MCFPEHPERPVRNVTLQMLQMLQMLFLSHLVLHPAKKKRIKTAKCQMGS